MSSQKKTPLLRWTLRRLPLLALLVGSLAFVSQVATSWWLFAADTSCYLCWFIASRAMETGDAVPTESATP